MDRIEKLEAALTKAKAEESEARACGVAFTDQGPIFYAEAVAIRAGIEATLSDAILDELGDLDAMEIAPGEFVPVSGLIDMEDRF